MKKQQTEPWAFLALIVLVTAVFGSVYSYTWAADGSGTNTVSPTSVTAGSTGNTPTFTFTAEETMDSGTVSIAAPSGWSAPQGTPGTAGYTTVTSSSGTVATVLDNADSISGWSAGTQCGNGLTSNTTTKQEGTASISCAAPNTAVGDVFYKNIGSQDWSTYSKVAFWIHSDKALAVGNLQFSYDDSNNLASPIENISVPAYVFNSGWNYVVLNFGATTRTSVASFGFRNNTGAGPLDFMTLRIDDILIGPSVPTFPGSGVIAFRLLQLALGQTMTITYGAGGGANGVTAPTLSGVSTFTTRTRASDAGLLQNIASQPTITVNPGSTSQFLLNAPADITAGTRAAYTVTRKDTFGNLVTSGTQTVYLYSSSTGANKAFYNVASGGTPVTSVTIADGSSTADFWMYDEEVGTWTVTASDHASVPDGTTGIDDATDSVTVQVGVATQFVMEDPTDGVVATNIIVTIRAKDAFGNVVTTEGRDVTLNTSGSATGAGLVDIVNGVGTKTISDTVTETIHLTLTDSESTGLAVSSFQDVDFTSGATRQFLLTDPGDIVAGTQLGYTVSREDAYGNPVTTGSDTVYLYSDAAGANEGFYDAESGSQITSLAIGTGASSAQFWYYDDVAGSATITASDNATAPDGLAGKDDATDAVAVTPAAISRLLLNDPGNMDAGTRLGYIVSREDAFGNLVTSGSQTVSLYSDSAGPKSFYDVASGGSPLFSVTITNTSSEASFWYYDENAGTPTITVSDNGSAPDGAAGIDDATRTPTVSPAATGQFLLDNPGDITVGTRAGYTVTRKDVFGNLTTFGSDTVYFYSNSTGAKEFYDAASGGNTLTSLVIGSGASTGAFWYTDDAAGVWTITASDHASAPDGTTGINDGTDPIMVTNLAIVATRLIIMDPTDGIAGDNIPVTIKAVDDAGSVETTFAGSVTLNLSGSATGGGSVTIENGIGAASIHDTVAESVHLSLADSGSTGLNVSSTQDVVFAVGSTSQYSLNDPGDTTAGTRLAYTVTRKDQHGNLVVAGIETASLYSTSASARFYDAVSGGSPITTVSFADSSSTSAFWYADEHAGDSTVTVSDHITAPDGLVGIDDATDAVALTPGPVSQFLLNDPGDMSTNTRIGYTVTRKDTFGNLVTSGSNTAYFFSNSTGAKAFYDAVSAGNQITSAVITEGNSSAAFWYFDDTAGTWTVTVSDHASSPDGAAGIADDADVVQASMAPIVATQLVLLDPTDAVTGDTVTVTVRAVDDADNLDTSFTGQVTLVLSGSATGEGLVNLVAGVGTKLITDSVAETVTLSLSDTETTGLNVASTQTVVFRRIGGGGGGVSVPFQPPEIPESVVAHTVLRLKGFAYPGAQITLAGRTATATLPLAQSIISDANGAFVLEYTGTFEHFVSYEVNMTDVQGLSAPVISLSPKMTLGQTTEQFLFAPPTVDSVRPVVLRGNPFILFGSATPGSRVEASIDGGDYVHVIQVNGDGSYRLSIGTLTLNYGFHAILARQVMNDGTVSGEGMLKKVLVSLPFNVKTDLNGDGIVNITDWSVFLIKWRSTDEAVQKQLDFNEDGKVDVTDFSIFIRSIRQ